MKEINQRAGPATVWLTAIAMMFPLRALAQGSRGIAPDNRFRASDDVQLGLQAVAQVERQLPTFPKNSEVDAYVERVGRRLVAAIPHEFLHLEFNLEMRKYTSPVVATRLPKKVFCGGDD